jgi:hypothetical protein
MLERLRARPGGFPPGGGRDGAPAAAVIRQHLEQIRSSRQFDASERNRGEPTSP